MNKSQGARGCGRNRKWKKRVWVSGQKEKERTQRNRDKHIQTVRDSKKNRKAKMQRERQKETDVETKIDPESVREKPKDRNLQRGVKNQRYTGK